MTFTLSLLNWYKENRRDLPWRTTKDAYKIWLSETILQQTRVGQGLPYYHAFLKEFPTVFHLALASEEKVLKLWQGLGYYSRARNMHETAKHICEVFQGNFPDNFLELKKLKGVGSYTAAAIASFCFDQNIGVVDGNVFRVLSRYFGIDLDISRSKTRAHFQALANELCKEVSAAQFNQAIMDFGALQCVFKNPLCDACLISQTCFALRNNKVSTLPVKSKKVGKTKRYFTYFIFKDSCNQTLINKRSNKDIWQGLYEFPLLETSEKATKSQIDKFVGAMLLEKADILRKNEKSYVHKLSHQELIIDFYQVEVLNLQGNLIAWEEVKSYAFPIVIWKFLASNYENFN